MPRSPRVRPAESRSNAHGSAIALAVLALTMAPLAAFPSSVGADAGADINAPQLADPPATPWTLHAEGQGPGHWEELGGDGRIWVPAVPPLEPGYLPPEDLGAYHNATEATAAIAQLVADRPDLFTATVVGTSVEGRPVHLVTLTGPGDATDRTRVLFDGAHHGDEVIGSEILIRFLQAVADEYDTNTTMQALLAQVVVDVVPMVNPDGIDHVPNCNFYADCRKNANGVDLNRNYAAHWGETGSSGDPGSAIYRGPSPLSEPESTAVAALMDQHDYALYASLHSGAEMILWPYGWTTSPPDEAVVYQALGDELSALTGAPHGQVSVILYTVSGDSMDHAYEGNDGWHPISISPETYRGSGSAFDWWFLFNPPESQIQATVDRWTPFLWHLVAEAPAFAPATLEAPDGLFIGPGPGTLATTVTTGDRRPFLDAQLALDTTGVPVDVQSTNPVPLPDTAGPHLVNHTLLPHQGGTYTTSLVLDAGPAGIVVRDVSLELVQAGLELSLDKVQLPSPEDATASVVLDAGPFDSIEGTVELRIQPEDRLVASEPFDATAGAPVTVQASFSGLGLVAGPHELTARASFVAHGPGGDEPGEMVGLVPFEVLRPDVVLDKRFPTTSPTGEPVPVLTILRSVGTMPAEGLELRETVPPGYLYWFRDGPVPIPPDPLGRPMPDAIEPRADGGVDLVFNFEALPPGSLAFANYRVLPLVPGTSPLTSTWTYTGTFPSTVIDYNATASPTHTAS